MAPWVPAAIIGGSMLASSAVGALSSKGGSSDVDYEWSDEQKENYWAAKPWMRQQQDLAMGGPPQMGAPPSIYDMPDATGLTPTKGWYDSIAPDVKQGLWEPWNDAANQLQMNMGAQGQLGTPGAGYSGAAGTGLGRLYADAGQQVGMQAWNMMAPGQSQLFGANLGRNVDQYNTSLVPWQQNYQSGQQDYQQAGQLMGNFATGGPTGIVSQQGNPWAGAASGALTGAFAGYGMTGGYQPGPSTPPYVPYPQGQPNRTGSPVDQWQYNPY
jgi:hypothetical protein